MTVERSTALLLEALLSALGPDEPISSQRLIELIQGELQEEPRPLAHLLELGMRLPSGLFYAEAIWMLQEVPSGLAPLSEGSDWYPMGQSLALSCGTGSDTLMQTLRDLGVYGWALQSIHEKLTDREISVQRLAEPLGPESCVELSSLFEVEPELLERLDAVAPGLREDLLRSADFPFDASVHVHPDVRPAHQIAVGRAIAERLLERTPAGEFYLALSDAPILGEHVSPYLRDLGFAISTWGLENPESLSVHGLYEALNDHSETPDDELNALVLRDLHRMHPNLVAERRTQEATQGLYLEERAGLTYGFAELERLDAPDETVISEEGRGTLVLLEGGTRSILLGALAALLDSERVKGIAMALSAGFDDAEPIIPKGVISEEDGLPLSCEPLVEQAGQLGLQVRVVDCLSVREGSPSSRLALSCLRHVRRAQTLERLAPEARVFLAFFSKENQGYPRVLTRAMTGIHLGKVMLSALLGDGSQGETEPSKPSTSGGSSRFQVRLRA